MLREQVQCEYSTTTCIVKTKTSVLCSVLAFSWQHWPLERNKVRVHRVILYKPLLQVEGREEGVPGVEEEAPEVLVVRVDPDPGPEILQKISKVCCPVWNNYSLTTVLHS